MINAIILLIGACVFLQKDKGRVVACLCVFIPTAMHSVFLSDVSGYHYYHYSALADGLIIALLCSLTNLKGAAFKLLCLTCGFFALNVAGYLMFMFYFNPVFYNYLSIALYVATLIVLMRKDSRYERPSSDNMRNDRVYGDRNTDIFQHKTSIKEATK